MIISFDTDQPVPYRVFDTSGNPIDCIEYDTETKEVTMAIPVRSKWEAHFKFTYLDQWVEGDGAEPIVLRFALPGSYAMDATGKRV